MCVCIGGLLVAKRCREHVFWQPSRRDSRSRGIVVGNTLVVFARKHMRVVDACIVDEMLTKFAHRSGGEAAQCNVRERFPHDGSRRGVAKETPTQR